MRAPPGTDPSCTAVLDAADSFSASLLVPDADRPCTESPHRMPFRSESITVTGEDSVRCEVAAWSKSTLLPASLDARVDFKVCLEIFFESSRFGEARVNRVKR